MMKAKDKREAFRLEIFAKNLVMKPVKEMSLKKLKENQQLNDCLMFGAEILRDFFMLKMVLEKGCEISEELEKRQSKPYLSNVKEEQKQK